MAEIPGINAAFVMNAERKRREPNCADIRSRHRVDHRGNSAFDPRANTYTCDVCDLLDKVESATREIAELRAELAEAQRRVEFLTDPIAFHCKQADALIAANVASSPAPPPAPAAPTEKADDDCEYCEGTGSMPEDCAACCGTGKAQPDEKP